MLICEKDIRTSRNPSDMIAVMVRERGPHHISKAGKGRTGIGTYEDVSTAQVITAHITTPAHIPFDRGEPFILVLL